MNISKKRCIIFLQIFIQLSLFVVIPKCDWESTLDNANFKVKKAIKTAIVAEQI